MKKVLIVDDALFIRTTLKRLLEKNDFAVVGEAENGKDGIEKYRELKPDIVTMDITMSTMNGIKATKEILEWDKNAVVVMISAMGQELMIIDAIAAGAKGFIVKPFTEDQVITTLNQL